MEKIRSTTILAVRRDGKVAIGGDGQVTFQNTVLKHGAKKIRKLLDGKVVAGFAGATADALTLFEKLESKLEQYKANLRRAAVELAKDWRTDRTLRRLEAVMIVSDAEYMLLISGTGDVIEPDEGIVGIGSGGAYAQASAKALTRHSSLSAKQIVEESLKIAASICIYTNENISIEEL